MVIVISGQHYFQQYFSYIMAVTGQFCGGGNQSTQRKPQTTNCIEYLSLGEESEVPVEIKTQNCIEYTSPDLKETHNFRWGSLDASCSKKCLYWFHPNLSQKMLW